MSTSFAALVACTLLGGPSAATSGAPTPGSPYIAHCLVSLIEDVQVPAQEAGLLVNLPVQEGDQVRQGDLLAQIDDRRPQMQKRAAQIELQAAMAQASDDIEVRYAEAAYKVAQAEHQQAEEINRKVANAVPLTEVRRLELTAHRASLQIDRSQLQLKVARMNAEVNQAQVEATEEEILRRQITSPIDGVVVAAMRQRGEWVNPGDPVLRVVRVDRLRIEGFLEAAEYNPSEIMARPVLVRVQLARGRVTEFPGKVVFVSPLVQAGNKYRVRADVENRQENGQWLLRPGMVAEMTIGK